MPSSSTVQAPHVPRSQTFFGPVISRRLRSASSSVTRGSTLSGRDWPLIWRVRENSPGPRRPDSFWAASAMGLTAVRRPVAAVPTPMPLRNPRLETPGPPGESVHDDMLPFV